MESQAPDSAELVQSGGVQSIQLGKFVRKIGKVIEQVRKEHRSFLIKRHRKELAIITSLTKADLLPEDKEKVFTSIHIARNRSILDEVAEGGPVWVSRRKKIVAKLVPPLPSQSTELSGIDREKLWLSRDITIEQLRIAVQLVTGDEITLKDVIENKD